MDWSGFEEFFRLRSLISVGVIGSDNWDFSTTDGAIVQPGLQVSDSSLAGGRIEGGNDGCCGRMIPKGSFSEASLSGFW